MDWMQWYKLHEELVGLVVKAQGTAVAAILAAEDRDIDAALQSDSTTIEILDQANEVLMQLSEHLSEQMHLGEQVWELVLSAHRSIVEAAGVSRNAACTCLIEQEPVTLWKVNAALHLNWSPRDEESIVPSQNNIQKKQFAGYVQRRLQEIELPDAVFDLKVGTDGTNHGFLEYVIPADNHERASRWSMDMIEQLMAGDPLLSDLCSLSVVSTVNEF